MGKIARNELTESVVERAGVSRPRRLVIRFEGGRVHSFDLTPGREVADLRRHLAFFPGEKVRVVEEQVYAPEHPGRFVYAPRPDLLKEVERDG